MRATLTLHFQLHREQLRTNDVKCGQGASALVVEVMSGSSKTLAVMSCCGLNCRDVEARGVGEATCGQEHARYDENPFSCS